MKNHFFQSQTVGRTTQAISTSRHLFKGGTRLLHFPKLGLVEAELLLDLLEARIRLLLKVTKTISHFLNLVVDCAEHTHRLGTQSATSSKKAFVSISSLVNWKIH
jgi:hypothetical protein